MLYLGIKRAVGESDKVLSNYELGVICISLAFISNLHSGLHRALDNKNWVFLLHQATVLCFRDFFLTSFNTHHNLTCQALLLYQVRKARHQ